MRFTKKITLVTTLTVLGLSMMPTMEVHAQAATQEREGIGVSPTKFTLDADPGERVTGRFAVLNTGTETIRYRTYVQDFSVRNEAYEKDFQVPTGASSAAGWFTVPRTTGTLTADKRAELPFTIDVPRSAVPRGYYAVIFAETLTNQADNTGVARVKRVGALVYLTVNGGSVERGELVSFDAPFWQVGKPVRASLRVRNQGNVHFNAKGAVELKDILGRSAARANLDSTVIPSTIRRFPLSLNTNQPFGLYRLGGMITLPGGKTALTQRWVLAGSPIWLVLWVAILVGWIVVVVRWIKRRGKQRRR